MLPPNQPALPTPYVKVVLNTYAATLIMLRRLIFVDVLLMIFLSPVTVKLERG